MNPELTAALAARHARQLSTRAAAGHASAAGDRRRSGRRLVPLIPRYRVTWTRLSLGLGDGGRPRPSSWAIVISATRTPHPRRAWL